MAALYWLDANGNPWTTDPALDSSPDVGWTSITLTAYNARVALYQANADAIDLASDAASCATRKSAYDALKASVHTDDWPESLFFFLTQFTPGDC